MTRIAGFCIFCMFDMILFWRNFLDGYFLPIVVSLTQFSLWFYWGQNCLFCEHFTGLRLLLWLETTWLYLLWWFLFLTSLNEVSILIFFNLRTDTGVHHWSGLLADAETSVKSAKRWVFKKSRDAVPENKFEFITFEKFSFFHIDKSMHSLRFLKKVKSNKNTDLIFFFNIKWNNHNTL